MKFLLNKKNNYTLRYNIINDCGKCVYKFVEYSNSIIKYKCIKCENIIIKYSNSKNIIN